ASQSPAELAIPIFAKATLNVLTFWPALRLASTQGWGRPESKTHIAEDILDLFLSFAEQSAADGVPSTSTSLNQISPPDDEIELVLLHALESEYALSLEDGSEKLVARDLRRLWKECLDTLGQGGDMCKKFADAAAKAKAEDGESGYQGGSRGQGAEGEDSDSDSESGSEEEGDEDGDVAMDGVEESAPEPRQAKAKEEPVIDEDGFQMVQKKKGRR
ncbi:hypothetical protein T439DRAFT_328268, partial [Meredithblackwellia eburnea MCA 4105]